VLIGSALGGPFVFLELDKSQVRGCVGRVIRELSNKNSFGGLLRKRKTPLRRRLLGE